MAALAHVEPVPIFILTVAPQGSKYLAIRYLPKTLMTTPNMDILNALC